MIARNFWRGDMNIFFPQIDWRRDGPGYVESELPVYSWAMALGYHVFGYHEQIGRVLALAVSLATLWAFYGFVKRLLSPFEASLAALLLWFNPIMMNLSTNIQPDSLMLLLMILSIREFHKWLGQGRRTSFILTALFGSLAIMVKLPALCIGLIFAFMCYERFGLRMFRFASVWVLPVVMLLPPLLWYGHSHRFWLQYGNSLGISNESHWMGVDFLRNPMLLARYIVRTIRTEVRFVFGWGGAFLAILGVIKALRECRVALYWSLSLVIFYFTTLRTSADEWAYYYHALSVPPASLLMALGCSPLRTWWSNREAGRLRWGGVWALALLLVFLLSLAYSGYRSFRMVDPFKVGGGSPSLRETYLAAMRFKPLIERDALVITVGCAGTDETGLPVAYDDSTSLFWLDRKGFVLCKEDVMVEKIMELKPRGARYFMGKVEPEFAERMNDRFHCRDQFGAITLYAL
jgi:4-amino-4-deoxy-L-arabinose transferase-like glycosyltransferase